MRKRGEGIKSLQTSCKNAPSSGSLLGLIVWKIMICRQRRNENDGCGRERKGGRGWQQSKQTWLNLIKEGSSDGPVNGSGCARASVLLKMNKTKFRKKNSTSSKYHLCLNVLLCLLYCALLYCALLFVDSWCLKCACSLPGKDTDHSNLQRSPDSLQRPILFLFLS